MIYLAQRADVAKGTLYRYFDSKEDMFRAVVQEALAANLQQTERAAAAFQGSIADFVSMLLRRAADRMGDARFPSLARMVLAESRMFPDLAAIWHEQLVARMLALVGNMIAEAQARGEVKPGDPKLYAFSIMGPMSTAVLFHEVFGSSISDLPDLNKLAVQHAETVLHGLMVTPREPKP